MYENTTSSSKFKLKVGHYYAIERRVNLEYKPEQIPGNKEGGTVILAISSAVTAELPNQETRRQSTFGEPECRWEEILFEKSRWTMHLYSAV